MSPVARKKIVIVAVTLILVAIGAFGFPIARHEWTIHSLERIDFQPTRDIQFRVSDDLKHLSSKDDLILSLSPSPNRNVGASEDVISVADWIGNRGYVTIFERTGSSWKNVGVIPLPKSALGPRFSVAAAKGVVIVGSPDADSGSGLVYIIGPERNSRWTLQGEFKPEGRRRGFGAGVSTSGNLAMVSDNGQRDEARISDDGTWIGERPLGSFIKIFGRKQEGSPWFDIKTVKAEDFGIIESRFVFSSRLLLRGDRLFIVGGWRDAMGNPTLDLRVFAFMISPDGTVLYNQTVIPPVKNVGSFLSVAFDKVLVLGCSLCEYDNAGKSGSVFLFEENQVGRFELLQKFDNPGVPSFGSSVSISGDFISAVSESKAMHGDFPAVLGESRSFVFKKFGSQFHLRFDMVNPNPKEAYKVSVLSSRLALVNNYLINIDGM